MIIDDTTEKNILLKALFAAKFPTNEDRLNEISGSSTIVHIITVSSNEVQLIVSNVTSLSSGDYAKDIFSMQHGPAPISSVRGIGAFENVVIPYSNISQTFIFNLKY